MVQSAALSVDQYLSELPAQRREVIARLRDVVNRHIPPGYEECMYFGMIGWVVPLSRYPETYNKQPLGYVALAAQKRHNALYMMNVYADSDSEQTLRAAYAARGLKLDMGKCCLRFADKAPPPEDLIAPLIAATPVDAFIDMYEASRQQTAAGKRQAAK
jgi:uncharacterized protein YdhG (YjbR/CyaY superfamily)